MKTFQRSTLSLLLALALGACGGDSGTGPDYDDDGNNNGNGGGDTRTVLADPSFSSVITEIFQRNGCTASSCHGSSGQAGLTLTAGSAYGELVNVAATQAGVARVIPGDANASYLIVKLEGRQSVGDRMPVGGSPLDAIDMGNLKNWINQGAKNN